MIIKEQPNKVFKHPESKSILVSKQSSQQLPLDTPKSTSFKSRFILWLNHLPLDQRYLALKVNAPALAFHLQESLLAIENHVSQPIKKDSSVSKKISFRQAKQIIDSIVLISEGDDFLDSIGFDFSYVEHPDKMYQLLTGSLTQHEKNIFQTEQYKIEPLDLKEVISHIDKSQSRQELALALIQFLRGEIFFKFEKKVLINLEEEKAKKKEFSIYWRNLSEENKKKMLMLGMEDFGELSIFLGDRKIILSGNDLERECNELLQMDKNQFCNKIFKCKLRKSLTYYTEYHGLIYRQWKSDLNKKKRRARNRKNSIQKKVTILPNQPKTVQINEKPRRPNNKNEKEKEVEKGGKKVEMKFESEKGKTSFQAINGQKLVGKGKIVNEFESFNGQIEKKQAGNRNSKGKFATHNKSSANLVKVVNNELTGAKSTANLSNNYKPKVLQTGSTAQSMIQNTQERVDNAPRKKRNRNKKRKSVSAASKQTNTTTNNRIFQKEQFKNEDQSGLDMLCQSIHSQKFRPLQQNHVLPQQVPLLEESSHFKKPIFYPKVDFDVELYSKVQRDIQEYSDLINEEANQFYERRVIAYERIQFILGLWKIPIKLFGSCASGITIKNSDIDIAVDNSILNYFLHMPQNARLKAALEQLETFLQQQPWVTSLKLIKTAAIPLIKLKVDTSIKLIQIPGEEYYQPYIDTLNREHLSSGEIHIDLTIETINKQLQSNHLGVISTDHINNWLKAIKSLHPIVIIIKNYLTKTNLNSTYEGGLNTYSMICLIVAFIKDKHLEENPKVFEVLEKLLKFYAFEFDQKTTGIDLLNSNNIFYDKFQLTSSKSQTSSNQLTPPTLEKAKSEQEFCQADLLIKDPLNNGKNMTKNCYLFSKIKQIFEQIYLKCFEDQKKQLQETFKQIWDQKWLLIDMKNPETQTSSKEVKELLEETQLKLGNPFLTLFE